MTHTFDIDDMLTEVEKFARSQTKHKEQALAKLITVYDFLVGSKELKHKLMDILPEGANIICSPYIESPTTLYVIKKFDITNLSEFTELSNNMCTQRCCLKNHNLGIIECDEKCYNRTLF